MSKPTLVHLQENGQLATRQTARAYTHVLLRKHNNAVRAAAIEASRIGRLADAEKAARRQFKQHQAEIAAGVGGQIPYWHGQGGFRKLGPDSFATHAQPDYQYKLAVEWMAKHGGTVEGYVRDYVAEADAGTTKSIEQVKAQSEDWLVISWHGSARSAKPGYQVDGDQHKIEAVNGGQR